MKLHRNKQLKNLILIFAFDNRRIAHVLVVFLFFWIRSTGTPLLMPDSKTSQSVEFSGCCPRRLAFTKWAGMSTRCLVLTKQDENHFDVRASCPIQGFQLQLSKDTFKIFIELLNFWYCCQEQELVDTPVFMFSRGNSLKVQNVILLPLKKMDGLKNETHFCPYLALYILSWWNADFCLCFCQA